jgi:hypothetical protein
MREVWEWLKRFRVWEAGRRIFLYAENWLQPERRDDQSPAESFSDDSKSTRKKKRHTTSR